jgi:ribonuclease PH
MFLDLIRQRRRPHDQLEIVELHRSGEEAVFSDGQLVSMLELGKLGIRRLVEIQE